MSIMDKIQDTPYKRFKRRLRVLKHHAGVVTMHTAEKLHIVQTKLICEHIALTENSPLIKRDLDLEVQIVTPWFSFKPTCELKGSITKNKEVFRFFSKPIGERRFVAADLKIRMYFNCTSLRFEPHMCSDVLGIEFHPDIQNIVVESSCVPKLLKLEGKLINCSPPKKGKFVEIIAMPEAASKVSDWHSVAGVYLTEEALIDDINRWCRSVQREFKKVDFIPSLKKCLRVNSVENSGNFQKI